MFKWSKRRPSDHPSTPKLASIALPDEQAIQTLSATEWTANIVPQPVAKSIFSNIVPERRSKTPHPPSAKSQEMEQSRRARTSSMTAMPKGILKVPKPIHWSQEAAASSPPLVKASTDTEASPTSRKRAPSTTKTPLKGILKPPKTLIYPEKLTNNEPVIPFIPPLIVDEPRNYNEGSHARSGQLDMNGGGHSYRPTSENHPKNPAPHAAHRGRYGPTTHDYHQASMFAPHPANNGIMHPDYYQPSVPMVQQGGYGVTHPNPYHPSSYSAGHSSRHGPAPSNMQRAPSYGGHSSRHGMTPSDPQRAPAQGSQPSMHVAEALRPPHRASTYPVYPDSHPITAPASHQQAASEAHHRSRHQSIERRPLPTLPGPLREGEVKPLEKYLKPHVWVGKAPQKEEAIALSWPLVAFRKRLLLHTERGQPRTPALFFDVAFNPVEVDPIGIRVLDGPYSRRPLTEEERNVPVSNHCEVYKMIIVCEKLEAWPINIERADGIRCIDVFKAIYDTYAVPLTRGERAKFEDDTIQKCIPAFKQRCKDTPGLTLYNEERGLCRVDLLRTKRIFRCLERDANKAVWKLILERPMAGG
ncbi:hypothetical protein Hypma_016439 [Hypsizygus marmoreus]|uniref:DUF6699 domain-containing protein n=1 Tax=Hypsizygus marmoreus TaxID=39966 RepID=A0A369J3F5_HYPMA|nr:hypothetical protein Hypma_016439 [Hypsizygus marmoreus]